MGRSVGHRFHLNHQVFIRHRLRKKRSDPDFSVQNLSDGNSYGCEPTELPGIFPDEKVWLLLSIIAENDFLKGESQLLPNHHIVLVSSYVIPELESQLLPNGSRRDGVGDRWVELESQLLPNRHIKYMAKDSTLKLESQLPSNGSIRDGLGNRWVELESQLLPNRHIVFMAQDSISKLESQLLPKHLLTGKMMLKKNLDSKGEISATIKSTCNKEHYVARNLYSEVGPLVPAGWLHLLASMGWITTLFCTAC